jgi:putative spermidine/putrescine transport system ATP-binding protein
VLSGDAAKQLAGSERPFALRPERIRVAAPEDTFAADWLTARGRIAEIQYHGASSRVEVELAEGVAISAQVPEVAAHEPREIGQPVQIAWPREAMVWLEAA